MPKSSHLSDTSHAHGASFHHCCSNEHRRGAGNAARMMVEAIKQAGQTAATRLEPKWLRDGMFHNIHAQCVLPLWFQIGTYLSYIQILAQKQGS